MQITVLTNGFVFVSRTFTKSDGGLTLTDVRCIRKWGTTSGLAQLVTGPTKNTVLDDKIPVLSAPLHSLVFHFEVSADAWDAHV